MSSVQKIVITITVFNFLTLPSQVTFWLMRTNIDRKNTPRGGIFMQVFDSIKQLFI